MSADSREYRYHCDFCCYTYIGPRLAVDNPLRFCRCTPGSGGTARPLEEKEYIHSAPRPDPDPPLSRELREEYTVGKDADRVRARLAERWIIHDKTHSSHGSNFSGRQTLLQIIKNLVSTVQGETEIQRIREAVINDFGYDIVLCKMVRKMD